MLGPGQISQAGSVAIGILVGLLSTCIQSVGLTLQRKSHLEEDSKEDGTTRRPAYQRRRWQIGMLMFVVSNVVGSTIQITTLPLPVLSTLQASGLVFNTGCASLILGEPFTRWSFLGTLLVAGGALLIAMFGAIAEPSHSLTELLELLGRQQFILWMTGTFIVVFIILAVALLLGRMHSEHSPRIRFWRGMCFGTISGVLSAHSLLVAKSAVELVVRTITSRSNQFNRWQSWAIVLLLIVLALTQLYFLHRGLKLCSTSVLYPFVFCIYNIIAILDGLIYFRQTSRLSTLHVGLIALGTVILLSGVLALSWRLEDNGSTPPVDTGTLLAPSMGIIEDTTTEPSSDDDDASTLFPDLERADDGTTLASNEHTPLLRREPRPAHETISRGSLRISRPKKIRKGVDQYHDNLLSYHSRLGEDSEGDADINKSHHRQIVRRTVTDPNLHSASDADDSRSPSPSNASPTGNVHKARAYTLTGTGIDVHLGAGIGASNIEAQTRGSTRQMRQERRNKRRRWSSRYRSASLPGALQPRPGTTSSANNVMNGTLRSQDAIEPTDAAADVENYHAHSSSWISWLTGRSVRRKRDQRDVG